MVEIVGHAAGQPPGGFHLHRVDQLPLHAFALGALGFQRGIAAGEAIHLELEAVAGTGQVVAALVGGVQTAAQRGDRTVQDCGDDDQPDQGAERVDRGEFDLEGS
jgi:hypothetical protein